MATITNSKLKLLYLMKIFLEKTDENHSLTVNDLINELNKYHITAERKAIYSDIELLRNFGMDIICDKTRSNNYFVASRDFELPELKLLVDAVQSSKFITHKKSNDLIKKIEKLASIYEAKELHRQVIVADRVKTMNENIYYNVDVIHKAIQENKQVEFKYFEYTIDKRRKYRRGGEKYNASPYALTWTDDNYYLIAYYERYNDISNFRVDRITDIELSENNRYLPENLKSFNVVEYSKKIFNMFSGDTETVQLQFDNSLINVIIDRFGKDFFINKKDEESFSITVEVVVSNTFLGWLFMFGDKVKIIAPDRIKEKMNELAQKVADIYKD